MIKKSLNISNFNKTDIVHEVGFLRGLQYNKIQVTLCTSTYTLTDMSQPLQRDLSRTVPALSALVASFFHSVTS